MRHFIHCLKQNVVLQQLPNSENNVERLFKWRFIAFQVLLVCLWNEDLLMSG